MGLFLGFCRVRLFKVWIYAIRVCIVVLSDSLLCMGSSKTTVCGDGVVTDIFFYALHCKLGLFQLVGFLFLQF